MHDARSRLAPAAGGGHTAADRLYAALAPLAFHALHLGARALGAAPHALRQRTGLLPDCAAPRLWLHGASAGEMAAAANLVTLLRGAGYAFAAAYTTTNDAGLRLIARRLAPGDVSALAPWDAPRWVARVFDRWQPVALVLVETELWPGLVLAAAQRTVPVICASARIYPRDVARYRLIRAFLRPTLRRLTTVLAQSECERGRFVALGVPAARCVVAGNLKHLAPVPSAGDVAAFRHAVGLAAGEPVWVAGNLHGDGAALLLATCERLPAALQRVIVAPRHAAALPAIEAAARRRGWAVARRGAGARQPWRILLLDSMGELRAAYANASVAVVGGSFAAHGGHDLVEPLRCGAPVLFGPHTAHVEPEAGALRAALPTAALDTPAALADRIAAWAGDAEVRRSVLARQRAALPDPGAVGAGYVAALAPWMQACRTTASAPPSS
jgi:3-deoxy-D-manno-octulosonic-acid transferase